MTHRHLVIDCHWHYANVLTWLKIFWMTYLHPFWHLHVKLPFNGLQTPWIPHGFDWHGLKVGYDWGFVIFTLQSRPEIGFLNYRINRRRYLSSRDHTCKFAQHHFELNNIRVCILFRRSILPLLNIPMKLCQINQLNETFWPLDDRSQSKLVLRWLLSSQCSQWY